MNITSVEKVYDHKGNCQIYKALIDGKEWFVPHDTANTDYQAIQEWAAIEGNNIIDPGA